MLLTHLGFYISFIRWVMSSSSFVSVFVLINREASPFFSLERAMRLVCPLSLLHFLLVEEGLGHFLDNMKRKEGFKGRHIS